MESSSKSTADFQEAQRRIAEAKESGQHWLNLGDLELNEIPVEIEGLPNLRQLGLGTQRYDSSAGVWERNDRRKISGAIANFSALHLNSLEWVDLSGRDIDGCSLVAGLASLQSLYLWNTKVSDVSELSGLTSLQSLDLRGTKVSDVSELSGLASLRSLNLSYTQVSDVSGLGGLASLQSLGLSNTKVSDVSGLGGLASLQSLDLSSTQVSDVSELGRLTHLEELNVYEASLGSGQIPVALQLPSLREFFANRIADIPPELLSQIRYASCLRELRSWWRDLQADEETDREIKIFVLGNGLVGKTQLCRALKGEGYDESVPSTHGVQLGRIQVFDRIPLPGLEKEGAVLGRLWDFGGQDIYHGTHALFLEGRSVFVIAWNPVLEAAGGYEADGLRMERHSLTYWLDYVRSLAGADAPILVVQTQCDTECSRSKPTLPEGHGFQRDLLVIAISAKLGWIDELTTGLRSATRYLLEKHPAYRLPKSWTAVRDHLRILKSTTKTLSLEDYKSLCRRDLKITAPDAVLTYLHRCGEVFYQGGLFHGEIVLDQEWALRAIYAVLDRDGCCQVLKQMWGIFTPSLLDKLAWKAEFSTDEQSTLISMMESCSVCFPLNERWRRDVESKYVAIDFLPDEDSVTHRIASIWREDASSQNAELQYPFLHSGVMRELLVRLGRMAGPDAVYWKYGCCFYDSNTGSWARLRSERQGSQESPGQGQVILQTTGPGSRRLLESLMKAVKQVRISQPTMINQNSDERKAPDDSGTPSLNREPAQSLEDTIKPAPAPTERPVTYVSYKHEAQSIAIVEDLEKRLAAEGWDVKRDVRDLRPGDCISEFELEIGRAKKVQVVISEAYLQSIYCMRELLYVYDRSLRQKADFLSRVDIHVVSGVEIGKPVSRLQVVRYWLEQKSELEEATQGIPLSMLGGAVEDLSMINDFCHHIEKMLRFISDVRRAN